MSFKLKGLQQTGTGEYLECIVEMEKKCSKVQEQKCEKADPQRMFYRMASK